MPWRLRREIALIVLGVVVMALSIVVLILNQSASSEILAAIGLVGGVAIIVNLLPANGDHHHDEG
jgi:hypothetical protein